MPHGHCYLWTPGLVWLHVVSDALTGLAYTSIPFTLLHIVRRRRDLPFNWIFLCFGLFIIACGTTHLMEIVNVWTPVYWLTGAVKGVTAVASVTTAILFVRLTPRALAVPTADDLSRAHAELTRAHAVLEERVAERTAQLLRKNEELAREISERKRAEEARLRTEELVARLSQAGLVGIVRVAKGGSVIEANDAYLRIIGYDRDELERGEVEWARITPPEWHAADQHALARMRVTGTAMPREKEYVRKDGTRVPVVVGGVMVDKSTDEVLAFVLDVSERHRAQVAALESEARKTAVMDAAPDAILIVGKSGTITEVNRSAENLYGRSRAELIGRLPADVLVPPRLREVFHRAAVESLQSSAGARPSSGDGGGPRSAGPVAHRLELPGMRRDGSEFPAEVALVRLASREDPTFIAYVRDITERRQAAEAEVLRAANKAAEEANTELEAFSYTIAHDLRAPLRAINGFSSAILDDWGSVMDGEGRDHLARIMGASQRMSELIDALLALARLTRTEPRRERVDLSAVANSIVTQLRASDPGRNVSVDIAPDLVTEGDPWLLHALLDNLLGNAWKFTSKASDARITFGKEVNDGPTTYYVRDNGAGFDMSLVNKLFAPFRRLHDESEFEGNGIGLATVQRIARRHGGQVWAEGVTGAGATFRFTLAESEKPEGDGPWIGAT